MIISRKWLHIFRAHSDSQLGPTLARLILQMQYGEERQTGMEDGGRAEEEDEKEEEK